VVRGRLVLWDVDFTLVDAGGAGLRLFRQAFTARFGRQFPRTTVSLAGRTDRAIALEVLTLAGVADPRDQLDAFQQLIAGLAPQLGPLVRDGGRVLPGAAEALAALAALDQRALDQQAAHQQAVHRKQWTRRHSGGRHQASKHWTRKHRASKHRATGSRASSSRC